MRRRRRDGVLLPDAWVAALLVAFLGTVATLALSLRLLLRELRRLRHAQRSQAVRHGQAVEQFAPFMAQWPWDPRGFRFLGDPIDGIQFNEDGIVLVEVKSGGSRLKPGQRAVREHVEAGRVSWREVRVG
jgi:predicted Holliday junction resolvase-like endonuclease